MLQTVIDLNTQLVGRGTYTETVGTILSGHFNVLEDGTIAKLVLIFSLHHAWSLSSQGAHCLEQVYCLFILKTLKDDAQCNKHSCSTDASTEEKRKLLVRLFIAQTYQRTYLQCTVIGPSWPNCSLVLCT